MATLRHAARVTLATIALAGCSGANGQAMPGTVMDTSPLAVNNRGRFHAATRHYSVRQVKQAFAAYGVQLRNVTPKAYKGLLAFLDGRPSHDVYVYVKLEGCKCALNPAIPNASKTYHGNLTVSLATGREDACPGSASRT